MKQPRPYLAFLAFVAIIVILFACSSSNEDDPPITFPAQSSSLTSSPGSSSYGGDLLPPTSSSSSSAPELGGGSSSDGEPTPPDDLLTLTWTGEIEPIYDYGDVFYIGTNIKAKLPESPKVDYEVEGGNKFEICVPPYYKFYDLEADGKTKQAGTFRVCAMTECEGRTYEGVCFEGTVVPNPSLSGSCDWKENPIRIGQSIVELKNKVTLDNNFGRCGSVIYDYPYTIGEVIPLGTPDQNIIVKASVDCGTYSISHVTCETLTATNKPIPMNVHVSGFGYTGYFTVTTNPSAKLYSIGKPIGFSRGTITYSNKAELDNEYGGNCEIKDDYPASYATSGESTDKDISVKAYIECNDGTIFDLASDIAKVVKNPAFTSACSWPAQDIVKNDETVNPAATFNYVYERCTGPTVNNKNVNTVGLLSGVTISFSCNDASLNISVGCPDIYVVAAPPILNNGAEVHFSDAHVVTATTGSGKKYYSIGAIPAVTGNVSVTNASADCGAVAYRITGSTVSAGNTVKGCAIATCGPIVDKELLCTEATVIANPDFAGNTGSECYWTRTSNPGVSVNSVRQNVPVTPVAKISKNYGRCGELAPDISIAGLTAGAGIIAAGAVKMVSTCDINGSSVPIYSNCPTLEVVAGSPEPECVGGICEITLTCDNTDGGACNMWSSSSTYINARVNNPVINGSEAQCGSIAITSSVTSGTITVSAKITCGDADGPTGKTEYNLGTVSATAVAAPAIGACAWDAAPGVIQGSGANQYVVVGDVVNAKATVSNCYGRCTNGAHTTPVSTATTSANVAPVTVSVATTGTPGTTLNAICNSALQVKARPLCDAVNNLAVVNGNAKTWNDICGGIDFYDVKWAVAPVVSGGRINSGNAACYWIKNMTVNGNTGFQSLNGWRLNGTTFNGDPNNDATMINIINNGKIDGGLYIYIPAHSSQVNNVPSNMTAGSTPYCAGGATPTLTCALGTMSAIEGVPIDLLPKLSCSDGTAPKAPISLGSIDLANPVAGGPYSNLTAQATCGGTNGLQVSGVCTGTLQVFGADEGCDGQRDIATYCPGSSWEDVLWNVIPPNPIQFTPSPGNNRVPAGCFWVKSWNGSSTNVGSNNSFTFRVNGAGPFTNNPNTGSNATLRNALNSRVDGGIYIWIQSAGTGTATSNGVTYKAYSAGQNNFEGGNTMTAGTAPAFCTNPVESLTCSGLPASAINEGASNPFTLSCHSASGAAPQNVVWSFGSWSSVTAGTHNVSATGTCDGKPVSANCGTLTVLPAGSIPTVDVCGTTFVEFTAGTYNVRTLTSCSGGSFLCYGSDGVSKTVTYNSTAKNDGQLANGNSGWLSQWSAVKHATNTTSLVVSAGKISCKTDW